MAETNLTHAILREMKDDREERRTQHAEVMALLREIAAQPAGDRVAEMMYPALGDLLEGEEVSAAKVVELALNPRRIALRAAVEALCIRVESHKATRKIGDFLAAHAGREAAGWVLERRPGRGSNGRRYQLRKSDDVTTGVTVSTWPTVEASLNRNRK